LSINNYTRWSCAIVLLGTGVAPAQVLLQDNFSTGSRSTGNLPTSAVWYSSNPTASTYVTNNSALVVSGLTGSDLGGQGIVAAFESTDNQLSLQVGQSLELSFDYLYATTGGANFGFSFGVYNSQGSPLTADGLSFNNSVFNAWTGYAGFGTFGPTNDAATGQLNLAQRVTTSDSLLTPFQSSVLGSAAQADGLSPGTWYPASLKLSYASSAAMVLTETIGNQSFLVTNTPTTTHFDTIAISDDGAPIGSLEISNVEVILIPTNAPVPEPSGWALAGLGTALSAWHRRRQAAAK